MAHTYPPTPQPPTALDSIGGRPKRVRALPTKYPNKRREGQPKIYDVGNDTSTDEESGYVLAQSPGQGSGDVSQPLRLIPTLIVEGGIDSSNETVRPQNSGDIAVTRRQECRGRNREVQGLGSHNNTEGSGKAKYFVLAILLLCSFYAILIFPAVFTDKLGYASSKESDQGRALVQPPSISCRPDYTTLATLQKRLTLTLEGNSGNQLLSSTDAVVEIRSLVAEFFVRGLQDGNYSCDKTIALLDTLRQIGYNLGYFHRSVVRATERMLLLNSAALATLRGRFDAPSNSVFNRLVNATSVEASALKVEVQSNLHTAKKFTNECRNVGSLFSQSCSHPACCMGSGFDLEIMRRALSRLDFFAHQLVFQFEEATVTLSLLQEKVGQLACHNISAANAEDREGDIANLEHGIQKLRERFRPSIILFFPLFDEFTV